MQVKKNRFFFNFVERCPAWKAVLLVTGCTEGAAG